MARPTKGILREDYSLVIERHLVDDPVFGRVTCRQVERMDGVVSLPRQDCAQHRITQAAQARLAVANFRINGIPLAGT